MNHPQRIMFVTRAVFVSGAEKALLHLLVGLKRRDHDVQVACGQDGDVRLLYAAQGIPTHILPLETTDVLRPWRFWRSVWQFRCTLRTAGTNILHTNDVPSCQAALLAARTLNVPRVCHVRFPETAKGLKWFLKYGVECLITVSESLRRELLSRTPEGLHEKIVAILDGIELQSARTEADRRTARSALGLRQDRLVFLFMGQFSPVKGVADLIRAAGLYMAQAGPPATFCLVGDDLRNAGAYRREMMELAKRASGGADMRFPGFQEDVSAWVAAADCVVVPSLVDPLGMTIMEAMTAGRMVIGSDVGGIPEMVSPGESGLLVPAGNPPAIAAAMMQAATDPGMRQRMERAAVDRARELFDLDKYVQRVEAVYRDLTVRAREPSLFGGA